MRLSGYCDLSHTPAGYVCMVRHWILVISPSEDKLITGSQVDTTNDDQSPM